MKKIVFLLLVFPVLVLGQSNDQNWIKTKTYKVATGTALDAPTPVEAVTQVSYFDGLGRPIQQIAHKQSNTGKDIVTHIEYDAFGRQTKEFLPFPNSSPSLNYMSASTVNSELSTFYSSYNGGTSYPFSQKELESSPLNRVFKQAAPGDAWAMGWGKEIKFDYQTNKLDEVPYFKVLATWDATLGLYNPSIEQTNFYAPNQLYKTITKDENWTSGNNNTTEEFKDKEGKVVLKRTYNDGEKHDTYYLYDQYGNLTYVLPPAAEGNASATTLDNLGYQYKYDYRNRLVEKKLPGKQWEFIVYDRLDRPVATGPAFSPYGTQEIGWMITDYDVFGRVVQTGWKNLPATTAKRLEYQNSCTSGNNPFPIAVNEVLTKNYYDSYSFSGAPTFPVSVETVAATTAVKGLATGSWVKVLDSQTSTSAEISYTLYDNRYRPIRAYTKNHLGGYTQIDSKLDWMGKTLYTITKHKRTNTDTEIRVKDVFSYSEQDKLVLHKQQINSLPEQLIAKNTYDELGQLTSKNVGGSDVSGANGLQKVDYSYNIRGWLKTINDVNDIGNDLFSFKINYNDADTATDLFNGNISETYWKTSSDNIKRKYDYKYDHLNRLLRADYSKGGNTDFNSYKEHLSYDKNGNIQNLLRNGNMDTDGMQFVNPIDNLTYLYDSSNKNKLLRVFDATANPQGFKDDNNNNSLTTEQSQNPDYEYDANGNMVSDTNKNIVSIGYNHLNLPTKILFGDNNSITYLYSALGQKVQKTVRTNNVPTTTDYMNGYQYINGILQFFPHAEGYVNATQNGSSYDYKYVFNYTDHLGNIRLSYAEDPEARGRLRIIEENHYYPFGLKHSGYNSDKMLYVRDGALIRIRPATPFLNTSYDYKYNGQEWQDELGLNVTAMDYRQYDNALGRFNSMDRLAELAPMWSTYRFAFNNPVYWKDPTGLFEDNIENFENNNLEKCPTCPNTPQFKPLIDDETYTYIYDPETKKASLLLSEVEVVAKSKIESKTLDYASFFNDRIGDFADILGVTNNRGGSFRLTNNGSYNPRNLSLKYYGSNWTGGSRAGIKTYNISKVIKNGSIATTVVLGTIEVGQGVADDYENYQTTGYTNGKNTAVASAKVAGGVGGAWAGAKGGAAVGAAIGVWFGGVGAAPGAVIGGIIGGAVGGWAGSEIGGATVEKAYE